MKNTHNKPIFSADAGNLDMCPVRTILAQVADKWSILILGTLKAGSHRFSELASLTPDISQRMLTQTLRKQERTGLILRTVTPTIPPRVDYELTDLGRSLLERMDLLSQWSAENQPQIEQARADYDHKNQP